MAPVPQAMPLAHAPQSMVLPQLSPTTPQYWPPIGVHDSRLGQLAGDAPHTLARPAPPQVNGALQAPQSSVPPQLSPITPQYLLPPAMLQVSGVQLAATQMRPEQVWPAGHAPQLSARPQPSPIVSQYWVVPDVQVRA